MICSIWLLCKIYWSYKLVGNVLYLGFVCLFRQIELWQYVELTIPWILNQCYFTQMLWTQINSCCSSLSEAWCLAPLLFFFYSFIWNSSQSFIWNSSQRHFFLRIFHTEYPWAGTYTQKKMWTRQLWKFTYYADSTYGDPECGRQSCLHVTLGAFLKKVRTVSVD